MDGQCKQRKGNYKNEPKKMLEIKNNEKNVFVLLISRLDAAEKRISQLEDISLETTKTEKSKENKREREKKNKISNNYRTTTKGVT